jgi:hypothetical protein
MRWGVLGSSAALAAGLLLNAGSTVAGSNDIAGTEWGSDLPCQMEVVRFHADGTAHVFYDSYYDFVDADVATWSQKGNQLTLKVDDQEYRGKVDGQALRLVKVSSSGDKASRACAFEPAPTVNGG